MPRYYSPSTAQFYVGPAQQRTMPSDAVVITPALRTLLLQQQAQQQAQSAQNLVTQST